MLMELILGFIESLIFRMDQVYNIQAIYMSFSISTSQLIKQSPLQVTRKSSILIQVTLDLRWVLKIAFIDIHCFE